MSEHDYWQGREDALDDISEARRLVEDAIDALSIRDWDVMSLLSDALDLLD